MGKSENFKAQVEMPLWVAANPLAWTLCGLDALAWGLSGVGPVKCIAGALQVRSACKRQRSEVK